MDKRIKELAEQAGYYLYDLTETHECKTVETDDKDEWATLERFAQLVRDDERAKCASDYLQDCCDAIAAAEHNEREAIAALVEADGRVHEKAPDFVWRKTIAKLIRARGNHGQD